MPITKYVCYRCKSEYYIIRKRKRRHSKYESSQVWRKSLEAAGRVDSEQLIHYSQTYVKEQSANVTHRFLENGDRNSDFHRNEKSNSLSQNDTVHDKVFFDEKQANQISALLNRVDDLEQELLLYGNLREDNFGLSSVLDLDQPMPNINEKANTKLTISKEFEFKDSKTVTINLCLNIEGKLHIE
ncbi:MAG TPA: hypothetical protein VFE53_20405 [Mucilaginibacter sp.]|jgi:hypothetical protein|nr:hypothetical protein [Mucilaginibacter sp.]